MKRRWSTVLKFVVTAGALAAVLLTADTERLWTSMRSADWRLLLLSLAFVQIGIVFRAVRWGVLLNAQDLRIPLTRLIGLYYVGTFFSSVLPGGFGGDLVRVYELSRQETTGTLAISTVLWERLLGLLLSFALAVATLPWSWRMVPPAATATMLALASGTALALGVALNPRVAEAVASRSRLAARVLRHERVTALYASFRRYGWRVLGRAGLAALGLNLSLVAVQACVAASLDLSVSLGQLLVFVPIISTLLMVPVSLGGLGVREGAYVLLFTQVGVTPALAIAMSLLTHVLQVLTGLWGGLYYAWLSLHGWERPVQKRAPCHQGESSTKESIREA